MNFDTLSGRDLDAMTAQHLFGLKVEPRTNARTGERDYVYEENSGGWVRVAFYAESMSASISVDAALQKRGWKRTGSDWDDPGVQRVVLVHADGRRVEAPGPYKEALCRAALKAVSA